LRSDLGFTVIMVTHDMDSLDTVADSVALMGEQKVVINAPMAEIEQSGDEKITAFFQGMREAKPVGRV
jgi:phospholipid/cholesterol/gamma-HCH transport system ATP-binding protein